MASASQALTWWQWMVYTSDVKLLWYAQPTFIISQAVFLLAGLTTNTCLKKGGRWPSFWLCTVLHGLYANNFWHIVVPEYDNFWHSQTPVMLLGNRLPLYIVFLYPAFIYHAAYAMSKLKLPKYAEPFAVGLVTVLIDIPYDIVAVKFVHWTWHDTDPNVYDRHYWIPWTSYYFHATFAASLVFFFHASRSWPTPKARPGTIVSQWQSEGKAVEWKSLGIATLLGMPGGVLMFVPIYHPLHDMYRVHTEIAFFLLFAIFLFVVFFNPEREWSTGLHEPVGPCNEMSNLITPFGQKLCKRKYLCVQNYDEGYFNFHSVGGQAPAPGSVWYTICGTPFENRLEYIAVVSTILFLATNVFYGLYFRTTSSGSVKKTKTK